MKPTDPTPEEYTNWIRETLMNKLQVYYPNDVAKFMLTELRDNSTTELNKLYFNECLTELKKL